MKLSILLTVLIIISKIIYSQNAESDATPIYFLSNNQHTGIFNETPVASAPEIKYYFRTDGAIRSTPAIFKNKIYFGCGDGYFYCLNETSGNVLWKFKTNGSVTSSPAVSNDKIYFASKDNFLYCINADDGILQWKFNLGKELFYKWEFDYYLSSPTVYNGAIYIGSGDGNLYAVNSETGLFLWKYSTSSRIRSTPAVADDIIYFGDNAGKIYALSIKTQKTKWIYETDGSKIRIEDFAFDRAALISSPTIYDNTLLIGSREGCLYSVDKETGNLNWKDEQAMSWVISTPAIYKENVLAGTSDGHFVKALNIKTGTEAWRYKTTTPVWSSVAIAGNVAYAGDYTGSFFAINADNGKKLWEIKTEDRIHGSPVVHNGVVYFGSDDGYLYAISGSPKFSDRANKTKKAVYWEEAKAYSWFLNKSDEYIRDYFVKEGYELLNSEKLKSFIEERINDHLTSAVVFARNEFPSTIFGDSTETDLLREFLKGDNKVVLLGQNPVAYIKNKDDVLVEIDFRKASKYFGIDYGGELTDAMKGLIPSYVTEAGIKAGLKGFAIGMVGISPDQATTVLSLDENGLTPFWIKNFGGPKNSGLVQLAVDRQLPSNLPLIKNVIEYGLQ